MKRLRVWILERLAWRRFIRSCRPGVQDRVIAEGRFEGIYEEWRALYAQRKAFRRDPDR